MSNEARPVCNWCSERGNLQQRFDHMKLEYDRMIIQINTYRGDLERLRRENHRLSNQVRKFFDPISGAPLR